MLLNSSLRKASAQQAPQRPPPQGLSHTSTGGSKASAWWGFMSPDSENYHSGKRVFAVHKNHLMPSRMFSGIELSASLVQVLQSGFHDTKAPPPISHARTSVEWLLPQQC